VPVAEILDPADPRLADYQSLTDVALRTRLEPPLGVFVAEGELVIRRAVAAGCRLRSVLLEPRWLPGLAPVLDQAGEVPVYVATPALLQRVTGFHVHRGALASLVRPPVPAVEEVLRGARRVVVVEDVASSTNLGALFRSAAGLGMDAVLLSPGCADPLYRRSVRVSMGQVLVLPWARLSPWPGGLAELAAAGFRLLALTPDPAATPLQEIELGVDERVAVLLGTEGPGLSAAARAAAEPVRIPMARGVDSLNVAAAAAIACWALRATSARDLG